MYEWLFTSGGFFFDELLEEFSERFLKESMIELSKELLETNNLFTESCRTYPEGIRTFRGTREEPSERILRASGGFPEKNP